jgi:hypothetical protein
MKRFYELLAIIAFGAITVIGLAGCNDGNGGSDITGTDNGTGNGNSTGNVGTIIVRNEEKDYSIRQVIIFDQETYSQIVDERVAIGINGGSKSFTVPPGKYIITIEDDDAEYYAQRGYYFSLSSLQFTVTAGGTKTVIYNLDKNQNNLIVE